MKQYIVITQHAWMNEFGSGVSYRSDLQMSDTRARTQRYGENQTGSDDFNIGTVKNGKLVALGGDVWDFDPAPDEADVEPHGGHDLDAIAEQIHLYAGIKGSQS